MTHLSKFRDRIVAVVKQKEFSNVFLFGFLAVAGLLFILAYQVGQM